MIAGRFNAILLICLLVAGCSMPRPDRVGAGGQARFEPWSYNGRAGVKVLTEHYTIHSTIENREVLQTLATVMESSLRQYQRFAPSVRLSSRPMECYIFARRNEWAQFTQEKTGADATIYLQINRGGYTVRDWYVAYFIGDIGTYAVAAHEGWHQYVARHFRSRLPPFLEEGIATMFETIDWDSDRPRWNLGSNRTRADKLRRAIEQDELWPLEKLIRMHAGDVVTLPGEKVETFYAQNWAFALFLWEAEKQRYRPALQRMLSDLAGGFAPPGINIRGTSSEMWDPASARPLLEHYLGMPLDEIEQRYLVFMRQLVAGDRRDGVRTTS